MISQVAKKLSQASVEGFYNPFEHIVFPETLEIAQWHMAPELLSLNGQPEYEKLSQEQRQKLSFFETINFFSLNIHGEKSLIEGLSRLLYDNEDAEVSRYVHHFIDEENKHMYFFGSFCEKYAKKIYPDRKFAFPREYAEGEELFLFFVKIFVFEEIVDYYNVVSARNEQVHELSREINRNHHVDEVRHLAFGRVMLKSLFEKYSPIWGAEKTAEVRKYIESYYQTTWREYYNPDIYADLGLENPYELAERTYNSDAARAHRTKASHASLLYLKKAGILEEKFEL